MKQLNYSDYIEAFPDKNNDYDKNRFEYIGSFEFTFDDVQQFLNNKGFEIHLKEVRFKNYHDSNDHRYYDNFDSLRKVLVAVPEGFILPDILPIDGDKEIYLTKVFRKLVSKHLLLG